MDYQQGSDLPTQFSLDPIDIFLMIVMAVGTLTLTGLALYAYGIIPDFPLASMIDTEYTIVRIMLPILAVFAVIEVLFLKVILKSVERQAPPENPVTPMRRRIFMAATSLTPWFYLLMVYIVSMDKG